MLTVLRMRSGLRLSSAHRAQWRLVSGVAASSFVEESHVVGRSGAMRCDGAGRSRARVKEAKHERTKTSVVFPFIPLQKPHDLISFQVGRPQHVRAAVAKGLT